MDVISTLLRSRAGLAVAAAGACTGAGGFCRWPRRGGLIADTGVGFSACGDLDRTAGRLP